MSMLLAGPQLSQKLTAQTKAAVLAWIDAQDGIMP